MYILAIKEKDTESLHYEYIQEFECLSDLKDHVVELGLETMTSYTYSDCDFDLEEQLSGYDIYEQVRIDEAEVQKLQDRIFDNLPKQLKDLAKKMSKRHLKVVV